MSRRKKSGGEEIRGDEWLATFSDTITLLLTFFVLLYSFSTVDNEKLKQIATSLQSVLTGQSSDSILEFDTNFGEVPVVGETSEDAVAPIDKGKETQEMLQKVKAFVEKNNLSSVVDIVQDSRGIGIQLRDSVIFESGSSSIIENSKPILDKINGLLVTLPNEINVEGHTDNIPIKNFKFESNWELSTARAGSVLRYFVEVHGQNPSRFKASGYGEYKPIAPNDTPEHRAMNRRVHILIVTNETGATKNE